MLKLYPGELQIGIKEREAFALWQKDGRGRGHRRRRHRARALSRRGMSSCRSWSAAAPQTQAKEFLALLDRYPATARAGAGRGPGRRAALEPAAEERHRRAAAGNRRRGRARTAGRARPRQQADSPATSPPSICGLPIASPCGCRTPPRRRAPRRSRRRSRRRRGVSMSTLQHGLTPKMKPLAPNRSALIARARCRHQQDRLPDRATEAAFAAGRAAPPHPLDRCRRLWSYARARHEGRRRDRPRRGRDRGAPGRRSRRALRQDAARVGRRVGLRRPARRAS